MITDHNHISHLAYPLHMLRRRNIPGMASGLNATPLEFSMHELLEHLLSQTGEAEVCISSFSITGVAIRRFLALMENDRITNLQFLFDLSVRRHRTGLLFFAQNVVSGVSLSKVHARLILIRNDR